MTTSKSKTAADLSTEDVTAEIAEDQAETKPNPNPNLIKKKDIYDHVTVATGLRKREVREAIDATFAYLFECLSDGKDVQCPPMGKIRAINKGDEDDVKMIYKLNLQKPKVDVPDDGADTEVVGAADE